MRKIINIAVFLLLILITYSIAWYVQTLSICSGVNSLAKQNDGKININLFDNDQQISFEKVVPYGFPFKLGIKFINITEEGTEPLTNQKYSTLHKGLITLSYDFIAQGIVFENKGESIVRLKPLASGFGVKVLAKNSYYCKLALAKFIKAIKGNINFFELINFIKKITIQAAEIKAYDLMSDELIYDHEKSNINFSWDRSFYYKNMAELTSNIPKKYHIKADINIKEVASTKKIIAPKSIIYFLLANNQFHLALDGSLTTKARNNNLREIIDNSNIQIKKLEVKNPYMKTSLIGDLTIQHANSSHSCLFDLDLDLHLNEASVIAPKLTLLKNILLKKHILNLFDIDEQILDLLNNQYMIKLTSKGNYSFSKKLTNLNLDSFYFMLNDNIGLNINAQSSFASRNDWYLDANVLVYNFEEVVNEAMNFLTKYHNYNEDTASNVKKAIKTALRSISSYPKSNSQDLLIDLQLNHNVASSKIGNIPLGLIIENYNKATNNP
jgi:hypothetical protein